MLARLRHLAPALLEGRQVLDEEDGQRRARPGKGGAPAQLLAGRGAAATVADLAHVDPATSHRRDVCLQVVALQRDHPEAPAPVEIAGQALVRAAGRHRGAVAQAQHLDVLLAGERDRVVGGPPGMGAARVDVEPDAPVGLDPALQVGDADHHVVDAGQHRRPARASRSGRAGSPGCTPAASGTPPACRSRTGRRRGRCGSPCSAARRSCAPPSARRCSGSGCPRRPA